MSPEFSKIKNRFRLYIIISAFIRFSNLSFPSLPFFFYTSFLLFLFLELYLKCEIYCLRFSFKHSNLEKTINNSHNNYKNNFKCLESGSFVKFRSRYLFKIIAMNYRTQNLIHYPTFPNSKKIALARQIIPSANV